MSGNKTEVTTSKLTQVAGSLNDLIVQYNSAVDVFYGLGAEIDAMWDGDANRKFMTTLATDRERFDALKNMLQRYVEVLNQDAAIYAKAESDVLNVLNTNTIR